MFFPLEDDFSQGMIQDYARHLLPSGAVWDALDVFINQSGKLSKRGGTKNIQAAASTMIPATVGIMLSEANDATLRGYIGDTAGNFYTFIPGSGTSTFTAASAILSSPARWGQPFQFGNTIAFPTQKSGTWSEVVFFGGHDQTQAAYTTSTTTAVITSGSPTITGFSGGDIANFVVGGFVNVSDATHHGFYRILSKAATTINVEPTPATSFTASACAFQPTMLLSHYSESYPLYNDAACGASYQNRVVLGNLTQRLSAGTDYAKQPDTLTWSRLPTEATWTPTTITYDGVMYYTVAEGYRGNFLRIPSVVRVVAVVPLAQDELLVLGSKRAAVVVGVLSSTASSYAVREVDGAFGCLDQAGVQKTPVGALFPTADGVCIYQIGSSTSAGRIVNTMEPKIKNYWQTLVRAGLTIYGSAYLAPHHYYISTSGGGLLCNLNGYRWTRVSNVNILPAAADPSSDYRIYAGRANASSSSQTYKLTRIDTILNPDSTSTADADAAAVTSTIKTACRPVSILRRMRRYVISPNQMSRIKRVLVQATLTGSSPAATVSLTPGLEGEGTPVTLTAFAASAAGPQRVRSDVLQNLVLTPAVGFTITQTGAANSFELIGIDVDVGQVRAGRTS